jgi:hypothetical protein
MSTTTDYREIPLAPRHKWPLPGPKAAQKACARL